MADNNQNKERYARAPYNFIPFPKKIFYRHTILEKYEDKNKGITILPKHNMVEKDLKTGYIDYSIDVETPLFISNGKKESDFFKVNGEYRIPGSTIRGKVRSNAEILSCSYPEFIEDKKLWFREIFFRNVLKDMYKETVLSGETGQISDYVKAGYLTKKGDKWFITPAKQLNNKFFKEIHESKLRDQHRAIDEDIRNNIFMYNFNKKNSRERLWKIFFDKKNEKKGINKIVKEKRKELSVNKNDYNLKKQIKELENQIKNIDAELRRLLRNNERNGFNPYDYKVSYSLKDNNEIIIKKVSKSIKDENCGILMNSSRLNYKQNHYLIFEKDTEKGGRVITKELINQYKTSVKLKQEAEVENFKINNEGKFENGKEKPIFYITDKKENIIAFGFTPYLKIPYKKSVEYGIKTKEYNDEETKKGKADYVKSIFGFTNFKLKENKDSILYKGRVSFTNAKPVEENFKQVGKPILKHLMGPKTSSFQLYLKQEENNPKKLKTYSSDDFELRGEKFYWLRNKHDDTDDYEKDKKEKSVKKEQYAKLYAVDKGAKFKGRIYFENLCKDELGLLLMSIKPHECAKENLGQGKPYGYGKVNFQIEDIIEIDSEKRFVSLNPLSSEKSIFTNKHKYINAFVTYMKKQNINVDFEKENMYKCFLQSKLQERKIWDREFNYMDIKEFKYRNILKPMESYINDEKNSKDEVAATKEES